VLRVPVAQIPAQSSPSFFGAFSLLSKTIEEDLGKPKRVLGIMRTLGSNPSAAKRLIRRCPMCKEAMGIVIANSVKNVRRIHGFCMRCGYGFRWAIITA
jgi:ribosomal protein L32